MRKMGRRSEVDSNEVLVNKGGDIAPHPESVACLCRERVDLSPGFKDVIVAGPMGACAHLCIGNRAF